MNFSKEHSVTSYMNEGKVIKFTVWGIDKDTDLNDVLKYITETYNKEFNNE